MRQINAADRSARRRQISASSTDQCVAGKTERKDAQSFADGALLAVLCLCTIGRGKTPAAESFIIYVCRSFIQRVQSA